MSDAGWDNYPIGHVFQRKQLRKLEAAAQHRLPHTWITIEGEIIEMSRMKNSHLRNTIEMLRRNALRRLSRQELVEAIELDTADGAERTLHALSLGLLDLDARASAAYGDVYDELLQEAMFRSDGDLEEWMQR